MTPTEEIEEEAEDCVRYSRRVNVSAMELKQVIAHALEKAFATKKTDVINDLLRHLYDEEREGAHESCLDAKQCLMERIMKWRDE